ncbi:MAG: hypothetical protein ABI298_07180 [Acidimicrobiales bacterium]
MTELDDRALATQLYNRCWEILEMESRSGDDDVELITMALTSRYHWLKAGAREQWIISDWMVSRAAGVVGASDLSLLFAQRGHDTAQNDDVPDWLVASTAEGVARAYAFAGNTEEFTKWNALAGRLVEVIVNEEDRALVASQLADISLP